MCLFDEPDSMEPVWEAEWDYDVRDALIRAFQGALESKLPVPTLRRWRSPCGVTVAAVESREAILAGTVLYQSWCELEDGPKYPLSAHTLRNLDLPETLEPADLLSREEVETRVREARKLDFNKRIRSRIPRSGTGIRRTQDG